MHKKWVQSTMNAFASRDFREENMLLFTIPGWRVARLTLSVGFSCDILSAVIDKMDKSRQRAVINL